MSAVFPSAHRFEVFDSLAPCQAPKNVFFFRTSFPRDDERNMLTDGFLCLISEQSLSALVPTGYRPIEFLAEDGIIGRIDNGSQWGGCPFCQLPLGDVMEGENDQRIPDSRQSARVKHKCPSSGRKFAVDLDSLEFMSSRKSCFHGFPHFGGFPFVVPQLADRNALRLISRNPKYRIEGLVRRPYLQFSVENNHGINYRVEDPLCVFPFVDGLLDTCAKGRDIRECENRPQNLAIASGVRSYSKKKTSIAIAAFDPVWCSVRDHPRANSIEILHARKGVSERTTEIRDLQPKHRHGGPVDADNFVFAADYNDRNVESIQHSDLVGSRPAQSRSVA